MNMPEKRGRKSLYTPEIAEKICEALAEGKSLRSICKDEGMPSEAAVRLWVVDDVNGFAAQYTRARDVGLDCVAEEVFEIADDGADHQRDRLKFDARRWYLSKLAPKRYGDKLETTLQGPNGGPIQSAQVVMGVKAEDVPEDVLRWYASRKVENTG